MDPIASTSTLPPSVLSCALGIRTQLNALPTNSPELLHPFSSNSAPRALSITRMNITDALRQIRSSLSEFEAKTLDQPSVETAKYLSLLRESSGSQAVVLGHLADLVAAQNILLEASATTFPILSHALLSLSTPDGRTITPDQRTIAILSAIASSLSLDSFQESATQTIAGENVQIHTLSFGGKTMVIDFEVHGVTGQVVKTKFSYALETQHFDEEVDRFLKRDLNKVHLLGAGGDEITREVESMLQRVKETLRELSRVDRETERTKVDCFQASKDMRIALSDLSSLQGSDIETKLRHGSGLFLADSLQPHILYHLSAARILAPEWNTAVSTNLQDLNDLRTLLDCDGASTISVSLALSDSSTPVDSTRRPSFIARFSPSVPITKAIGRQISEILAVPKSSTPNRLDRPHFDTEQGVGLEDLLVSASGSTSRFNPKDTYRIENELGPSQTHSLANPGRCSGYLLSEVVFDSVEQLPQIIQVVRSQCLVNELLVSAFSECNRVADLSSSHIVKRQKLNPISLEELFADSPLATLPISLHLDSATPPSISISFPSPHTIPSESFPITLRIIADASKPLGLGVECSSGSGSAEISEKLDAGKMERILGATRDIGLLVDWVVSALCGAD